MTNRIAVLVLGGWALAAQAAWAGETALERATRTEMPSVTALAPLRLAPETAAGGADVITQGLPSAAVEGEAPEVAAGPLREGANQAGSSRESALTEGLGAAEATGRVASARREGSADGEAAAVTAARTFDGEAKPREAAEPGWARVERGAAPSLTMRLRRGARAVRWRPPYATLGLIGANAAVSVVAPSSNALAVQSGSFWWIWHADFSHQLHYLATLFGAAFFHTSLDHLTTNMELLLLCGVLVERRLGAIRFAGVFLLSSLAGAITSTVVAAPIMILSVGASDGVAGLMGAVFYFLPAAMMDLAAREARGGGYPSLRMVGYLLYTFAVGCLALLLSLDIHTFLVHGFYYAHTVVGGHVVGALAGLISAAILDLLARAK